MSLALYTLNSNEFTFLPPFFGKASRVRCVFMQNPKSPPFKSVACEGGKTFGIRFVVDVVLVEFN